jgi:hypothetical protein
VPGHSQGTNLAHGRDRNGGAPRQPVRQDAFQAALLTWLAEHGRLSPEGLAGLSADDLQELLRFATRAAAITCSRRGP